MTEEPGRLSFILLKDNEEDAEDDGAGTETGLSHTRHLYIAEGFAVVDKAAKGSPIKFVKPDTNLTITTNQNQNQIKTKSKSSTTNQTCHGRIYPVYSPILC